ncbi:hypothetical protein [Companilactobacillus sp.]|jgi:hypothetical protein|uniref:hypothetical protein n=1 Tax=Companilactobacillus sp. TaxID=2767905 RepID=UPI0025C6EBA1|nr:hypothetical protein [Companilactobacillus sp.]MCH4009721.1 hypothetical protein [Companilactobacillus sp.]MCH4052603.1 hypothetical protein [Companilactobacillus sp.]MCH4077663.1 hypothetical protein [Companilactobacillus sp.]MCH4126239.1 hypothetical protein [Companilactobacillus sp.]MCI1311947.1 hypothetical protein [Companilactobacillus sp.]
MKLRITAAKKSSLTWFNNTVKLQVRFVSCNTSAEDSKMISLLIQDEKSEINAAIKKVTE